MGTTDENRKDIDIFEKIEPDRLRTVSNFREMMPGACDVKVEIELNDESSARLTFPAPWDGKFYCYYRTDVYNNKEKWYINDWGNGKCLFVQESDKKQISDGFVKTDDVLQLLEQCRRIPVQREDYREATEPDMFTEMFTEMFLSSERIY